MIDVVAGIILNDEKKILLARRIDSKNLSGYWEFPGGKVEPGESKEQALIRELKEELNIEVEVLNYFSHSIHKSICLYAFYVKYIKGEILLKDHDKYEWVDQNDLLEYILVPADLDLVNKLIKSREE